MSKFQHYMEAVNNPTQNLPLTPNEMDATPTKITPEMLDGKDHDGVKYVTFSQLVDQLEELNGESFKKYAEKQAAVKKWLKANPSVLYYSHEKPEGGDKFFIKNAVEAAKKANKKIVIGENLS